MGVLDEIGYSPRPANAVQRIVQRAASSRPGAWLLQRTLYPVDKLLFRATKGRVTVPGVVAGLPVILLTTTGAKTGQPRSMPLLGVPIGDDLAIIGSNYGQAPTPGWVHNLEADPQATVAYRDRSVGAMARRASEEEVERAFERAVDIYPGYATYRARAEHRDIRVFVLQPVASEA